jgi:hypothetical protein
MALRATLKRNPWGRVILRLAPFGFDLPGGLSSDLPCVGPFQNQPKLSR